MSESNHPYGVNWATYGQVQLELESALRIKIANDIEEYAEMCRQRGLNGHFTSALDLAADIALMGPRKQEPQEESLF
jgi:hypothetical protein